MSGASFHIRAGQVQSRDAQAFIGQVIGNYLAELLTNKAPATKQVSTITVGGANNSTPYTVTIDGESASYTSDATATVAEIHAGLIAAINAAPAVRGKMVPSGTSPTLTLTGVYPGIAYTVSVDDDSTGDLGAVAATTATDSADPVSFGLAMVKTGFMTDEADPVGHVATTSDFTAQVITVTVGVDVAANSSLNSKVQFRGKQFTVDTPFNASHAQTLTDHTANLNTLFDAQFGAGNGLVAANNGDDITITAENPGDEFEFWTTASGAAGDVTKAYTTGPSTATSFMRVFAGVSKRRHDIEDTTLGGDDPAYPANVGVETVYEGDIWVSSAQSISYGDGVYVSLATATKGKFYNAIGTDYVWLPPEVARWERDERSTGSASIALLRVNAQAARRVY